MPKDEFLIAFAKLVNMKPTCLVNMSLPELGYEILKHWRLLGQLVVALFEFSARGKPIVLNPNCINEWPLLILEGSEWYDFRMNACAITNCINRYNQRTHGGATSFAELEAVIDDGLGSHMLEDQSRSYELSRAIPKYVLDIADPDYMIGEAIRNSIYGRNTAINKGLAEKAYPFMWSQIFRACNIDKDHSCITRKESDYPGYGAEGPNGSFVVPNCNEFTPTSGGKKIKRTVSMTATPSNGPNTRSKTMIPDLDLD